MELRRCCGCMKLTDQDICPHCGCPKTYHNDQNQLPVGTVLHGQYVVGKVLGHGGFGITYIGWDRYLDIPVAIKEFYPAHAVNRDITQSLSVKLNTEDMLHRFEESRERFLREAKTLAKLRSIPQIVGIQGFFTENNTAYIIMDYVQGQDLRHFVQQRNGNISAKELLPLLEPVLHALAAVHREGLMHRDISPDNIMLLPDGKVVLLDFGAAHDLEKSDADADLSHSTEAILKHGFAPMEQYRSRGNLGPWTDEYGFCASIYYCLTGQVPPDAPTRAMDEVQPDWASIPGLTSNQRAALEKGMEMRAKDRFGSMEALHKALYQNAPVTEEPRKKKRGWVIPLILALLLAAAAAGSVWYWGVDTFTQAILHVFPGTPVSQSTEPTAIPTETTVPTEPSIETAPPTQATIPTLPEETTAPTEPPKPDYSNDPWYNNVLIFSPLVKLNTNLLSVSSVTFLDSTETVPWNAVDVSVKQDGSVMAWGSWSPGYNVYIAADGGINAKNACSNLFRGCVNMQKVSFGDGFHTEECTDMSYMFRSCTNLTSVDLGTLDTSNVTSMAYMFSGCSSLKNYDISDWDVSGVMNMSGLFYNCSGVQTLDVKDWDTSSVSQTDAMFFGCTWLSDLPIQKWDVSNVTSMTGMFEKCNNLVKLDVSRWNTASVTNTADMFYYCNRLQELDVSNWDVSHVTDMSSMFRYCSSLQDLDVSNWDVSRVRNMEYMFFDASLDTDHLISWDVSNVRSYDFFLSNGSVIDSKYWTFFFEGK